MPKEVLSIPRHGCINVHGSLLPKYRGASPIQASIINCEEETGVSIIQMTENLDDGDILKIHKTPIGLNETYLELSERLSKMGALAILEVLKEIEEGTLKRIPQKESERAHRVCDEKRQQNGGGTGHTSAFVSGSIPETVSEYIKGGITAFF